ncbi:MAG: phage tail spike protein, partial [Paraclostridium dentum]|uniref:phage tail protein n=1 Tax=Paraclostridium dentum TaxID=2662455 RepID=UPI003EE5DB06
MLQLRDIHKKKIAGLTEYKNLYIESELQSGDKTLCFSYPKKAKYHSDIVEECYIDTKENQYIVKEKNVGSEYTSFKCILNLEELEGQPFERYASEEQTIDKALALALAGTGWIVGKCNLKKRRTVRISNCSSLDIIKEIKKIYRCDLVFNTLTKTIDVYESLGEDKGAYFIDSLNLKDLSIQGNSYDYYTRIIPIGKDDLRISSINNGKDYVENYQYSNKIKTFYWKDERYTVVENLKEDAEAKLNEISKPYQSYSAEIINLAKLNDKYKNILDYKLGDTITLISKENKFRDKQRIVKITEHPEEHELDTVELANTTLSFEETQTQFQEAADTVDNITTDNGTIDGSTIDNIETKQISDFEANVIKVTNLTAVNAKIHNLEAQNVNITGKLTAVEATIGTLNSNLATIDKLTVTHSAHIADLQASKASITQLEAVNATIQVLEGNVSNFETSLSKKASIEQLNATNAIIVELQTKKANIDDLNATNATITELKATKADIKDLQVINGNITNLNSDLANIKTLVNGNLSSENIQAGGITSDKLTIANGFITNAMIDNLDVSKVNAGDISTSKFRIKSDDGGIEIVGATQQFKDKNNKVRIQMGKDAQGNFNFIIRGEDGTTTLIDHTGIKQKAIADDLIISNMISSDAVGEKQINYNSFVTGFNKDTNTNTLKATKIKLDNQNQSLEIAFNSLKTQSDGTKNITESHSTSINVMQGQINTAINNTQIVKDGQIILLKDDYNRTLQTVNSINSTLGSHTTQINEATGKITSVDTKVNSVQRDLESTKISVSSNSSKITDLNTITKNQSADINVLKNQISLKVEQSDIEKSINNIEIGGVNLVLNSAPKTTGWSWSGTQGTQNLIDESTAPRCKALKAIFTASGSSGGLHKPPKQRLAVGQKYSWSVWIKASKNITMSLGHEQGGNKEVSLTTEWQKFTHTFIATNREYQSFVFYAKNVTINDWYCVHSLKLEDGDKQTSYSEAPEDLETLTNEKISNAKAEIKITTDTINQTVSNLTTTVSTKADNSTVTNVSNKVSSLETNLNSITGKVSNLETSVTTKADKSTTYTKTEADALIKVKSDEINLNLTKNYSSKTDLTDAINNIEIGGRNLLFNSGNFTSISGWDKNGGTILEVLEKEGYSVLHGYGSIRQPRILPIEPNTEYIYSCEIMFEKDTIIQGTTPLHFHVLKDNSGNSNYASYTKIGLTPTTYPYTVKANAWFRITYKFAMG